MGTFGFSDGAIEASTGGCPKAGSEARDLAEEVYEVFEDHGQGKAGGIQSRPREIEREESAAICGTRRENHRCLRARKASQPEERRGVERYFGKARRQHGPEV